MVQGPWCATLNGVGALCLDLTLLVNPLWHLLAANLFSVKYYKKYLCILK